MLKIEESKFSAINDQITKHKKRVDDLEKKFSKERTLSSPQYSELSIKRAAIPIMSACRTDCLRNISRLRQRLGIIN